MKEQTYFEGDVRIRDEDDVRVSLFVATRVTQQDVLRLQIPVDDSFHAESLQSSSWSTRYIQQFDYSCLLLNYIGWTCEDEENAQRTRYLSAFTCC